MTQTSLFDMNIEISNTNSLQRIRELAREKGENDISLLHCADILINIKKIETFLDSYKKAVRDEGIKELDRITERDGFLISKTESTINDYTNNSSYMTLLAELNEVKKKIKSHEAFLKSLKGKTEVVDTDGEVTTFYPPIKRGVDRITITEKNNEKSR